MRFPTETPDFKSALARDFAELEEIHSAAMRELVADFVEDLRGGIRAAGLGDRLANTWRGKAYPGGGKSLHPAGYVWSKAPKIVGAFAEGATILPTGGRRYVAIPTKNVPLKARGRRMTPLDVEVAFNQDLIIRNGRAGRKLAFVSAVAARKGRGFRAPTKGRLAAGRATRLILMFILVPSVRLAKRLDPDAAFRAASARYDTLVQGGWDRSILARDR